jgi:hypothetical protein
VVADLRDQHALDGLEHRPAVAEEAPVGAMGDRPQPEPVRGVALLRSSDPCSDAVAIERRRVVAHRHWIRQHPGEVVDVVRLELTER